MGTTQSKVTPQDKAILDLKLQRDKLHQYQRKISHLTALETNMACDLLARGDKPRALLALRRKKYQESLLIKTDSQLRQLQALVSNVEFALIQKDIVFGLEQGTKVLQEIHREMGGVDKIEKMMGERDDELAYQQEISEMLGSRITVADEEEVEDELAELEAQVKKANTTTREAAVIDTTTKTTSKIPTLPDNLPLGLPQSKAPVPAVETEPEPEPEVEGERRQAVLA